MFLLNFEASDDEMVFVPSMMSMILGCLNACWCLSSSPISARNILRMQVFCAGSYSMRDEAWLLMTELVAGVLFSS